MSACEICHGERQVKVGWHPVSNIKIKVEYDPCPNCTPGPHSFHAKQTAGHIRAIYARDRAIATPVTLPEVAAMIANLTIMRADGHYDGCGCPCCTRVDASLAALETP